MPEMTDKTRCKRGMNPKSLANLRPFQKGNKANPDGRPLKDCSLTSLVKSLIDTVPPGEKQGRTWRQLLALAWLAGAMKNPVLMKELLDRLEGKVSQPVTGEGGGPVKVEIDVKQKLISELARIATGNDTAEDDRKS